MSHVFRDDDAFSADETAPTEAWLFARLIRGEPIPPIINPEARARAKREELERLAQFSSRHAEQLSRIKIAEAEARRERESLEWAARISTRAEEKLRALQQREAEEREAWRRAEAFYERYVANVTEWNPDQPRVPPGSPQGGQWSKGGGVGVSAGEPPSHLDPMTQHNRGFADHTSEPDGDLRNHREDCAIHRRPCPCASGSSRECGGPSLGPEGRVRRVEPPNGLQRD